MSPVRDGFMRFGVAQPEVVGEYEYYTLLVVFG